MRTTTLIDVAEVIDSLHQTPTYVDDGIPMVRVTDVKKGNLSLDKCLMVSEKVYQAYTAKYVPKKGDIVISRVGSYGNFAYVADDFRFCLGQNTAIISPKINSRFLFYFLISPEAKRQIERKVVGSTQKTISLKNIKGIEIPIVDELIQNKIATILECIDDKIATNDKINQNLQEQARVVYNRMIIEGADDSWTSGKLSEIADSTMGQSPKGDTYNEDGIGTLFFQGRAEFGFRFPTRRLYTTEPKRMARANDVLMSVRAPVGDLNVAYENCCIGRGLGAIHSKDGHQSYVLYTLFDLQEQLDVFNGEGTVFGSINRKSLNSMPIIIPPKEVLDRFERIVGPMDAIIRNKYEEKCRLEGIRDALLPRLMSGELDVSELTL